MSDKGCRDPVKKKIANLMNYILHGGCFAAGTLVATAEGLRPIEQVRAGDQVLAADQYTGQRSFKPVVETFQTYPDALWEVSVQVAGKSHAEVLNTTEEHPFYVVQGAQESFTANSTPGEWVAASLLQEGDRLRLADDTVANVGGIRRIAASNGSLTTYNFTVADHHTYFVGRAGIWVHNACPPAVESVLCKFRTTYKKRPGPGHTELDDFLDFHQKEKLRESNLPQPPAVSSVLDDNKFGMAG